MPWKSGGGGPIAVVDANDHRKFPIAIPVLTAHQDKISDLCFSPFHENILLTASFDSTLKLWKIPDGGILQDVKNCDMDFRGHSKKVLLAKWNPTAENCMASAGQDGHIKIWDV